MGNSQFNNLFGGAHQIAIKVHTHIHWKCCFLKWTTHTHTTGQADSVLILWHLCEVNMSCICNTIHRHRHGYVDFAAALHLLLLSNFILHFIWIAIKWNEYAKIFCLDFMAHRRTTSSTSLILTHTHTHLYIDRSWN